jgi:hypothetical protein
MLASGPAALLGARHLEGSMRTLRSLGLVLLVVTVFGCSGIRVNTDWDTTKDFSGFRSYSWLPHPPDNPDHDRLHNALIDARVREAVNTEMAARGFRYSTVEGADLLVTYYLGLETKLNVDTIHTSYGYGYRGWYGGGPVGTQTRVSQYEEGTLMIDILAPPNKDLLWRGTASTRVGRSSSPEKSQKTINSAVSKMFKKFPPESK